MAEIVIKPDPDKDEYVLWSTIVQDWFFSGTAAEILDEVAEGSRDGYKRALADADALGSSGRSGRWADETIPVGGIHAVPRAQFMEYVTLTADEGGDPDKAAALLLDLRDDDDDDDDEEQA